MTTEFEVTAESFDGFNDLVIGVPFEDIGNIEGAGATNILFGSANSLMA